MPDYAPVFEEGRAITCQASAAITGGQLVYLTGDYEVAPTEDATAAWLGVASTDAQPGDDVTVYRSGTQRIVCTAAVSAGDLLVAASAGRVTPAADPGVVVSLVGLAETAAAAGGVVEVGMLR